ncbi:MAG: hypothetical protein Q4C61_05020 [Lachnospiraceae bacterium]|nr:hypothetical protein [Lachnospiraceae bacterium]
MSNIHSTVTELPASCKSSAERMARELAKEDFADITESCRQKITDLEHALSKELGEKIALVAYRA